MAKKFEYKDNGDRCCGCGGPGPQMGYVVGLMAEDNPYVVLETQKVTFHDTCVGSWLSKNPQWTVHFRVRPV